MEGYTLSAKKIWNVVKTVKTGKHWQGRHAEYTVQQTTTKEASTVNKTSQSNTCARIFSKPIENLQDDIDKKTRKAIKN